MKLNWLTQVIKTSTSETEGLISKLCFHILTYTVKFYTLNLKEDVAWNSIPIKGYGEEPSELK